MGTPWAMPDRPWYRRAAEWGTESVGLLKLQYGREWTAEDYMDLIPPFPDLSNHEARRASVYTPFKGDAVRLDEMRVVDICTAYTLLKNRVPSKWNDAWIQAFEQELDYRATRNAYETQTEYRHDIG